MKEKLIEEINNLPKFELRGIAVKQDDKYIDNDYFIAVIEEGKPEFVISVVSNKYQLVQFKDIFIPAVENIEKINNYFLTYYKGKAYLEIYPEGEEFLINSKERVGLALKNSVDKAWAVNINFVISSKDFPTITLPSKLIKGLRKVHVGNMTVAKDFLNIVNDVKEAWKRIVDEFQNYQLKKDELEEFAKQTKIGARIKKKIEKIYEDHQPNLWEIFVLVIKEIGKRRYKSEIHKKEKIERITNAIFNYALVLSI